MSLTKTFWTAEEKIPIAQTKVSIPSENNLSYSAGGNIVISIPESIEYFNPINSYLEFDVLIKLPTAAGTKPTRLCLDKETGGNSLIKDLRIIAGAGGGGAVLEELQDVNCLTALKYDYHVNDNLRKKRGICEGSMVESELNQLTLDTEETQGNNHRHSPYWNDPSENLLTAGGTANDFGVGDGGGQFQTAKLQIKLESGIFQNRKIFPCKMLGGLQLSIQLEENSKLYRQLDGVGATRSVYKNPLFGGRNGALTTNWANGDGNITEFYLLPQSNSQVGDFNYVAEGNLQCPFVVGESVQFIKESTQLDAAPAAGGYNGTNVIAIIDKIECDANGIKITLRAGSTITSDMTANQNGATTADRYYMVSTSIQAGNTADDGGAYEPTITISNVNMVLEKVDMPSGYTSKMLKMMKEGGQLTYDFISFTNYKYSQLSTDRVANIRVPLMNARCKSILCVPTDATIYDTKTHITGSNMSVAQATGVITQPTQFTYQTTGATPANDTTNYINSASMDFSERSGLVGLADGITDYIFTYSGKLNPNRPVLCSKTSSRLSIDQQLHVEQEKALSVAGIPCLSFKTFQRNFFIGRAFALGGGSADVRNKDFNLQVNYKEDEAPKKNKLWNNYVMHVRRIVVRGEDVSVEL